MGCTPSIHVSQTGVMYCRESEESNSPRPSTLVPAYNASHTTVAAASSSCGAMVVSHSEAKLGRGAETTVVGGGAAAAGASSSSLTSSVGGASSSRNSHKKKSASWGGDKGGGGEKEKVRSSGDVQGALTTGSTEAETQTSRQSMKNLEHDIKFGPMLLHQKAMSVLLVFGREDRQSDGFWWAAEKLGYRCNITSSPETALETYLTHNHDTVIIDARQTTTNTNSSNSS
ncbi:high affinity cAMP-specific and IBMX-insensitive 3',5'-cyclic phosphodiesterase 8B, partial [Aplysia californica]|uniref:High affinity cAMP-specific and IBMX-insensitive 3',5'-cyclic phosphodiesterase 8B n=1 Tax=Aplysia californica TaxID=6500 RepID=A0ABM0JPV8_APLCA